MSLQLDFTMDDDSFRHFLNGHGVVMHSHHYLTLITKLVEELPEADGRQLLMEVVEGSMREIFDDYLRQHGLTSSEERLTVGQEYYAVFGLGKLQAEGDADGGEVRITSSHLDEGWIRKWGERQAPVNHFTCGYIAAMFAAAFGTPPGSYRVSETASMVSGAAEGRFQVVRNQSEQGDGR